MARSSRIVDVHTHVYLPRYVDMLKGRSQVPRIMEFEGQDRLLILPNEESDSSTKTGRPIGPEYVDPTYKLKFMDQHGIDISIVSLANPWLDFVEESDAIKLATLINKDLQQWCETHQRLYFFGALPTLSVKGCVDELHRIASLSKAKGVIMGSHGLGKGLDDPLLEIVFKTAADVQIVIFLHPHYGLSPELYGDRPNGHVLPLALGFPFETSIALSRLILCGIFDRIPDLKLLVAHSGGALPFLAGRLDACVSHDSHVAGRLQKPPSEYLKNLYYDAVNYQAPAMRTLVDLVGYDRIMFGTDNPFFPPLEASKANKRWESVEMNRRAISTVLSDTGYTEMVLGGNAMNVFDLQYIE